MNNNNKSQFFSTKKETIKWLNKYKIQNYTINDDLSVDVNDDVSIFGRDLKAIPIKFGNVTGKFWCSNNKLTSLTGSPKTVGGDFLCHRNQLTNLLGSPEMVGGIFSCCHNELLDLVGSTKTVNGDFFCYNNKLTSIKGAPKIVGGDLNCASNQLTSLAGSPENIGGYFSCVGNKLKSLTELRNCDLKGGFLFSVDKKNFKPKELIQVLDKYKNGRNGNYVLSNEEFNDKIKPILQKIILQQKLIKNENSVQIKRGFI